MPERIGRSDGQGLDERAHVEMIMGLPFSIHLRGRCAPATPSADAATPTSNTPTPNTPTPDAATPDASDVENAAVRGVWADLRESDRVFSTYRPDSEISRINRGELTVADADPGVRAVLELADEARAATAGGFDIRYGGRLDPSGIVKGWAAARAARHLRGLGCDWYLNAGGDILLHSGSRATWRIGIEHPSELRRLLAVVTIGSGALATSGAAHRGRHIVDPVTGAPARGVTQVSVCGPSLVWADVFATAMVVSPGPLDGRWHLPPGYEFLLVADDGAASASPGMVALLEHSGP